MKLWYLPPTLGISPLTLKFVWYLPTPPPPWNLYGTCMSPPTLEIYYYCMCVTVLDKYDAPLNSWSWVTFTLGILKDWCIWYMHSPPATPKPSDDPIQRTECSSPTSHWPDHSWPREKQAHTCTTSFFFNVSSTNSLSHLFFLVSSSSMGGSIMSDRSSDPLNGLLGTWPATTPESMAVVMIQVHVCTYNSKHICCNENLHAKCFQMLDGWLINLF